MCTMSFSYSIKEALNDEVFYRFGCDISYNDRSTRSAHEKKKHGTNFREGQQQQQVNGAGVPPQLANQTIPGQQHL